MSIFSKIYTFLKDSKIELKKVSWPTKQQTVQYTILVIAISLIVALFLGILDLIFFKILSYFI